MNSQEQLLLASYIIKSAAMGGDPFGWVPPTGGMAPAIKQAQAPPPARKNLRIGPFDVIPAAPGAKPPPTPAPGAAPPPPPTAVVKTKSVASPAPAAVAANVPIDKLHKVFEKFMGSKYDEYSALDRKKLDYLKMLHDKNLINLNDPKATKASVIYNRSHGYGKW